MAGVVPLSSDRTRVLLIQSTSRKGWVLPKGGWETDEERCEDAACREAWEEAGIECVIDRDLGTIPEQRCDVQLRKNPQAPFAAFRFYEVRVEAERDSWPEAHKRHRAWVGYADARERLKLRPELLEALERSSIER